MGDLKIKLKLFQCRKCNRRFTSGRALSNHMHFHTRRLGRRLKHPISWFSSDDEEAAAKPNEGKALADLGPDPSRPSPEECAAWNLVFLSRDSWGRDGGRWSVVRRARTQQVCGTCGKAFRSHQALGGHRAGHVKAMTDQAGPGPEPGKC